MVIISNKIYGVTHQKASVKKRDNPGCKKEDFFLTETGSDRSTPRPPTPLPLLELEYRPIFGRIGRSILGHKQVNQHTSHSWTKREIVKAHGDVVEFDELTWYQWEDEMIKTGGLNNAQTGPTGCAGDAASCDCPGDRKATDLRRRPGSKKLCI
jgi:hypothetical protein